jgi:hypothetical protein
METMETSDRRSPANVKLRQPWVVVVLCVLTLGTYTLVWYYKINREMRDFGIERGDDELAKSRPWVSLLAVTLGALLVVPRLVSLIRTVLRLESVERLATGSPRPGGGIITLLVISSILPVIVLVARARGGANPLDLLSVAALLTAYGMLQSRLNAAWRAIVPAGEPSLAANRLVA